MNAKIPKSDNWTTAPISPTCQVIVSQIGKEIQFCEGVTEIAYPAMGGGWMAMCLKHGKKHLPHAMRTEDLIRQGEKWE